MHERPEVLQTVKSLFRKNEKNKIRHEIRWSVQDRGLQCALTYPVHRQVVAVVQPSLVRHVVEVSVVVSTTTVDDRNHHLAISPNHHPTKSLLHQHAVAAQQLQQYR